MADGKKQAVVIVHGIGEQRPMDTVREFVKTVWAKDHELENARFWSKPSEVSQSFEQRRLTTDYATIKTSVNNAQTSRVDFYEYYWAHHTVGTSLQQLKDWLSSLLFRSPFHYPKPLLPIWCIIWGLILVTFVVMITLNWPNANETVAPASVTLWSVLRVGGIILMPIIAGSLLVLLVNYLGDVARYVTSSPSNIPIRQAIRKGGVELIESIVNSGKYDRIVLVGHSLGTIISYDILIQLWARQNKFKNPNKKALGLSAKAISLIEQLETIVPQTHQKLYRQTQNQLFHQLQQDCEEAGGTAKSQHQPWLISDFVTLGSPLTYADFLLFKNSENFTLRKLDREYPTSPPVKEEGHFYYSEGKNKFLHHGAVFAPVRWTNIYSPHFKLLGGDIISGPLSAAFNTPDTDGTASDVVDLVTPIKDIAVTGEVPGMFSKWLTHTNYWKWHPDFNDPARVPEHILILRDALDLKKQHFTLSSDSE